jgi:hypothetical protein
VHKHQHLARLVPLAQQLEQAQEALALGAQLDDLSNVGVDDGAAANLGCLVSGCLRLVGGGEFGLGSGWGDEVLSLKSRKHTQAHSKKADGRKHSQPPPLPKAQKCKKRKNAKTKNAR